jgi:hypothetical protein
MSLPDYDISQALESYLTNIENTFFDQRGRKSPFRSAILEEHEDYTTSASQDSEYSIEEIALNMILRWIEIQSQEEQARFLVSPSKLFRQAAKQVCKDIV